MLFLDFMHKFRKIKEKNKRVLVWLDNQAFYRVDNYDFENTSKGYKVYLYCENVYVGGCNASNIVKLE